MITLSKITLFLLIFLPQVLFAQRTLSGRVIDNNGGQPIAGASIYINSTTIGRMSNEEGNFSFDDIPLGTQELVISYVGYETISYSFSTAQLPLKLDFKLKPKVQELNEVTIEGNYTVLDIRNKQNWQKFKDGFLGITPYSDQCTIQNIDDIELRYVKETRGMKAVAKKPIVIVNKALGYIIEYDLEHFELLPSGRILAGKSFFKELSDKELTENKRKLRNASYYGSMSHFLRSVYNNSLNTEGFEVRSIARKQNVEKERVLKIVSQLDFARKSEFIVNKNSNAFDDSSAYYRKFLSEPGYFDAFSDKLLNAEDIKTVNSNGNTIFKTTDTLLSVTYTKPLDRAISRFFDDRNKKSFISKPMDINKSIVELKGKEIIINPKVNGVSKGLKLTGYFSFIYGVSTLLPNDYEP
ncbi:MAG: carboxypeptidase-like regulatory domain-containing protein [Sphingobacteriaceae bacterium]|nr:carboxypeptidase-like regulatory domain-containing protein [Sphingobacteriaceae bacterium]